MALRNSTEKSTSSEDDESARGGRYAAISPESVRTFTEATGIGTVSDDVLALLSEDLSYRLREVLYNVQKLLFHSRREKATCEDVNNVLQAADVDPVFGHLWTEKQSWMKFPDMWVENDPDVDLVECSFQESLVTPRSPPTVKASWVSVEMPENRAGKPFSKDRADAHATFFEDVVKKALSADFDARKFVLDQVRTNQHPGIVTPWLVELISKEQLTSTTMQEYFIDLTKAIVWNPNVCWENSMLLGKLCDVMHKVILQEETPAQHWQLRERAANVLAYIVLRRSSPCHDLYRVQLEYLRSILNDNNKPLCSLVGCIQTLGRLGVHAVSEVLLPNITNLFKRLDSESSGLSRDSIGHDVANMLSAAVKEALYCLLCKVCYTDKMSSAIVNNPRAKPEASQQSFPADFIKKEVGARESKNLLLELSTLIVGRFGDSGSQCLSYEFNSYFRFSNYEPKIRLVDDSVNLPSEVLWEAILAKPLPEEEKLINQNKMMLGSPSKRKETTPDGKSKAQAVGRKRRGSSKRGSKRRKLSNDSTFEYPKSFRLHKNIPIEIGARGSLQSCVQRPIRRQISEPVIDIKPCTFEFAELSTGLRSIGKCASIKAAKSNVYGRFVYKMKQVSCEVLGSFQL